VGKEVARRLQLRFIDTDQLMQQRTGLTIAANLAKLGDELFIQLEEGVLLELGNLDNCLVSPGGSVIYSRQAMDFLTRRTVVIFLDVPLEVIQSRVGPQRGVVRLRGRTLEDLFNERLPLYKHYAHRTISAHREVDFVAGEIAEIVKNLENGPPCGHRTIPHPEAS